MSYTQQQIIDRVENMSELDARFVLEVIERLIPDKKTAVVSEKMRAFQTLETMRGGFPENFDPEKELREALDEKYGFAD